MLKCKYAWSHLDFLQGEYAPCYRFKIKQQPIASLASALPSEVINNSAMQNVRASLQQGVFPPGCEDCALKESRGLKSYRQKSLSDTAWDDSDVDYNSTTIKRITDLELKFSRTCNLLCRHCMADSNSQFEILGRNNPDINDELQQLDFDHMGIADSPIATISPENLEDIIQNIIPTVDKITFSGGEPLYHLAHYRFLERLIQDPKIDASKITIAYNTNMTLIQFKGYKLKKLWPHFKSVELTVSMDGTGKIFDYFRERGNYETVVKNLETVLNTVSNIKSVYLVCTCTSYHAFYAHEIFKDLTELAQRLSKYAYIHVGPTFVHYPEGLDMVNLPSDVKQHIVDKLYSENIADKLYQSSVTEIIKHLTGDAYADTSKFAQIVKIQDRLHNKSALEYAPKLGEYVYNNKLVF